MATNETNMNVAGKNLTFKLNGEEYGLPIAAVQEIIRWQEITRVPRVPNFILGVLNLRGRVVPGRDLRRRFGLPPAPPQSRTCIIILQSAHETGQILTGIVADEVTEVVEILPEQVGAPPELGSRVDITFVGGVGQLGARVILLLRVDKILDSNEWFVVEQMTQTEKENSYA